MAGKRLDTEVKFDRLITSYHDKKQARDARIGRLVSEFRKVIESARVLDDLGSELAQVALELTHEQMAANGQLNGNADKYTMMDIGLQAKGKSQQMLIDAGAWPMGSFTGDASLESQTLLSALSQFVDIKLQTASRPEPRFVVVAHDGERVLSY